MSLKWIGSQPLCHYIQEVISEVRCHCTARRKPKVVPAPLFGDVTKSIDPAHLLLCCPELSTEAISFALYRRPSSRSSRLRKSLAVLKQGGGEEEQMHTIVHQDVTLGLR